MKLESQSETVKQYNWSYYHTNPFQSFQHQLYHRSTSFTLWLYLPRNVWCLCECLEDGREKKKEKSVRQSFSSSPPPQVKDSQARKPHPAPQPSAVPQELPGSTPTEPVSSSPAYPPTHPASSTQHPVAGGSSLSEGICVFERQGPERSLYCMCNLRLWACLHTQTHTSEYGYTSTSKYTWFVLVTDTISGDFVTMAIPSQHPGSASKWGG